MQLVAPLASGIVGAANGTAEFYRRGTSSASSLVYADANMTTAVTSTALDANGGAVRYVGESVDVIVRDSSGVQLRSFTVEDYAANVEVRNAGFTGVSSSGASIAGGRTTLDAVLTSLYTTFGGADAKVAGQYVKDVVGNSTSIFINVKSSAYGAKGDGVTDDRNAIQSAIAAAVSAGGAIVYFPPGTYVVNGVITITSGLVRLLGVSSGASIIKQTASASNQTFLVSGAGVRFEGLGFTSSGVSNGAIAVLGVYDVVADRCSFTAMPSLGALLSVSSASSLTLINCDVTVNTGATVGSNSDTTSPLAFIGCRFTVSSSSVGMFAGSTLSPIIFIGCTFASTVASGTAFVFTNSSISAHMAGCYFTHSGGGAMVVGNSNGSLFECGCAFNTVTLGVITMHSQFRDTRENVSTGSATSYTPNANEYRSHKVTSSGASFQFATPTGGGPGQRLTLRYKNTNAGAITPTFGVNYKIGTAPSVPSNSDVVYEFEYDGNLSVWMQVGGNPVAYAA